MKWRNILSSAVLVIAVAVTAFGCASTSGPSYGSREWYLNRPYERNSKCGNFGNPWIPAGAVPTSKNPQGVPPLDAAQFNACQKPYWDYAMTCFAWDPVRRTAVLTPTCSVAKPE